MRVDLEDKVTRFVVQEYVNAIVGFSSPAELDFDAHKLIHTFQVVDMAQKLIALTKPALSLKLKKQILNAAVLHDIGRCHEFQNGKPRKKFNHGLKGADLIRKQFPKLVVETLVTQCHNRMPSYQDPANAQPVLDYIRDADILGNIIYNVEHMSVFLRHILQQFPHTTSALKIDHEIIDAALNHRSCRYQNMKKMDFLDNILLQLCWIYNLRTKSGLLWAKKERIFPRIRDVIISEVLPAIPGSQKQRQQTAKQILKLFPDELFLKEFKKHGL